VFRRLALSSSFTTNSPVTSFCKGGIGETIDEIKDVLLNLKLGKAVGNDKISHNMLKHTASTVCKPLEIIFNCSLLRNCLSENYKYI
jgi:hypothetical protein